jgi:hypothetical protein
MEFTGTDIVTQLLTGVAAVILLYIAMAMAEYLYKSFMTMWRDRVELFPDTYVSGAKMFTAVQNPNNPKSKLASLSDNQRSGVEFSYSMFINLDSATFSSGEAKLHHIMHKGYSQFFPLMGPGVFCWGNKNSLRIYMNSYKTWNEYTEIDNIPVDNWFHLTISCKGTTIYIYINGNLKQKMKMSDGTPPYQNYGDVYLFSGRKKTIEKTNVSSLLNEESLRFDGAAKGMASRVFYFSYAVTYSEIQSLMNMGPSSKVNGANASIMTPYLSDTWWTTNGTQLSSS